MKSTSALRSAQNGDCPSVGTNGTDKKCARKPSVCFEVRSTCCAHSFTLIIVRNPGRTGPKAESWRKDNRDYQLRVDGGGPRAVPTETRTGGPINKHTRHEGEKKKRNPATSPPLHTHARTHTHSFGNGGEGVELLWGRVPGLGSSAIRGSLTPQGSCGSGLLAACSSSQNLSL